MAKKLTKSEHKKMNKQFPITSLCREDLISPLVGFSKSKALKITDEQMKEIANRMADDYCEQMFWISLQNIADYVLEKQ